MTGSLEIPWGHHSTTFFVLARSPSPPFIHQGENNKKHFAISIRHVRHIEFLETQDGPSSPAGKGLFVLGR